MSLPVGVIRKAIENAEKSQHPKARVGAVVFKSSRILSEGMNDLRSFQAIPDHYTKYSHSLHAEIAAILNAEKRVKGYNILVIRIDLQGNLKLAKPCEWCSESIRHFGLKNVYYSTDSGEIVKSRAKSL